MSLRNTVFSACLGLSTPVWAAPAKTAETIPEPARVNEDRGLDLPFESYTLDNGLKVILHHDARLPLVAVSVWYDVGGLHERRGRSGFAHLFEHMMFQRSAHVAEDQFFPYLEMAGGTRVNGTTSYDRTNYFETVPKNELELALWLESDRMGFLLPAIDGASLANQIEVVKNERRQRVENAPYGLMSELITQTLFPEPHPYFGDVIGSMADLEAATVEDVRDFFLTYYTPANATLTIAGDYDPATIKEQVKKYFGPIRGRSKPLPPKVETLPLAEEKVIKFVEPVGTLPRISIAWLAPPSFSEGNAAIDVLAHVLSGTKSARLDKRVSHDELIAQSVSASFSEFKAGSVFQIDLVTRPGRSLAEAQTAIDQVLAELKKRPPTEAEVRRALNSTETEMISSLEVLGGFSGRAERLQTYNLYFGEPDKLAWDVARYRSVTANDVKRALDEVLTAKRLIVHAEPTAKTKTSEARK